jgi:hypothetical protein
MRQSLFHLENAKAQLWQDHDHLHINIIRPISRRRCPCYLRGNHGKPETKQHRRSNVDCPQAAKTSNRVWLVLPECFRSHPGTRVAPRATCRNAALHLPQQSDSVFLFQGEGQYCLDINSVLVTSRLHMQLLAGSSSIQRTSLHRKNAAHTSAKFSINSHRLSCVTFLRNGM